MKATQAAGVALALTCGCIRLGYDATQRAPEKTPDASQSEQDAGGTRGSDGAVADAATDADAAVSGTGGTTGMDGAATGGEAGSDTGGAGAGGGAGVAGSIAEDDAGPDVDEMVGDTGLHVSDILGFYSGDWGDMVLRKVNGEIWGVYQYDGGTIVGEIKSDGVFSGWWSQSPTRTGTDAGEVEFRWSQATGTAIMLDGRWRYGTTGDWVENWDINLVTDRAAPTALTDRFSNPDDFKRHP